MRPISRRISRRPPVGLRSEPLQRDRHQRTTRGPRQRVCWSEAPLVNRVAGEGFEPSKLSRWIYRPTYAARSRAASRLASELRRKFATESGPTPISRLRMARRSASHAPGPSRGRGWRQRRRLVPGRGHDSRGVPSRQECDALAALLVRADGLGGPVLALTTRLGSSRSAVGLWPFISRRSASIARMPTAAKSWRTVVSGGMRNSASGMSSNPITLTSSGTNRPHSCRARKTPMAI